MFRKATTWALTHPRTVITIVLLVAMIAIAGDPAAALEGGDGGGSLTGIGP